MSTTQPHAQPHAHPHQVTLPGQAHTAEGPHDQTGMYVMHFALRRDFARFVEAAAATPVEDAEVWAALADRWRRTGEVLHHHHGVEDAHLWPLLTRHAEERGDREALAVLRDMEAEHGVIDPALAAVGEAFAQQLAHPCTDHRNALVVRLGAAHDHLLTHLAHEEGQALPLLQRTLSAEENAAFEKQVERAYPLRAVAYVLPWALDGLPAEARDRLLGDTPPGYGLASRLLDRRYQRRTRVAFRHA